MVPEAVEAETKLRMEADPTLNMTKEEAERRPYSLLQAFIFTLTAVTPPFLPPVWDLEATRDTFGGDEDCAFPLLLNRAEGRLAAEVEPGLLQRAHAANFDTWRGNEYRQGLLLPSLVIESDVESRYKVGRTETLYACFKYRVARGELVLSRDHLAGVSGLTGRALLAPLKRGEAVVREGSEGRYVLRSRPPVPPPPHPSAAGALATTAGRAWSGCRRPVTSRRTSTPARTRSAWRASCTGTG